MSDQNINQLGTVLKDLNAKMDRLGRTIDELDILAHQYQRLSLGHKELAKRIDHIDVMVFAVRLEFDKVRTTCRRIELQSHLF